MEYYPHGLYQAPKYNNKQLTDGIDTLKKKKEKKKHAINKRTLVEDCIL